MSGHNKWSTIKYKKAATDAKRGKAFTKIIRELTIAAREGGGDPSSNPRLRTAMEKAKEVNMPKDNIEKAVKKGTGELEGVAYEEFTYEGYGPHGVAVFIEIVTDNRNRTSSDVRSALSKYGGNLGENGCVSWIFEKKGVIVIAKNGKTEDELMDLALEAGADDLEDSGEDFTVTTPPERYSDVLSALKEAGLTIRYSELEMVPKNTVKLDDKQADSLEKLVDILEDNDDIQNVYLNYERVDS